MAPSKNAAQNPCVRLKELGNHLHSNKQFSGAIAAYSEAIKEAEKVAVSKRDLSILYCNRAASLIEIGSLNRATDDVNTSLTIDQTYQRVSDG